MSIETEREENDLYRHDKSCLKCDGRTKGHPAEGKVVCKECGFSVKHHERYDELRYAYLN